MIEYKKYLEVLAKNNDSAIFGNASAEHACIVMSTIFKNAKKDIRIFAKDLCGDVSNNKNIELRNEYVKELINFIEERKGHISILLDEFNADIRSTELFSKLSLYSFLYPERIKIKKLKKSVFTESDKKFHFTVADGKMYRFENDTINYTAIGSFNEPDFSKKLTIFFDSNFSGTDTETIHLN